MLTPTLAVDPERSVFRGMSAAREIEQERQEGEEEEEQEEPAKRPRQDAPMEVSRASEEQLVFQPVMTPHGQAVVLQPKSEAEPSSSSHPAVGNAQASGGQDPPGNQNHPPALSPEMQYISNMLIQQQ